MCLSAVTATTGSNGNVQKRGTRTLTYGRAGQSSRFLISLFHQPGDLRFYQPREVCVLQPDRLHMVTGIEVDMLVLLQRGVDINLETKEVAEGRHRADLTIRETRDEFIFGGEPRLLST